MWTVFLILAFLWFLIWLCSLGNWGVGTAGVILVLAICIWIGNIPEKLTAPELEYSISHTGFLSDSYSIAETQPDGTVVIAMSDNRDFPFYTSPRDLERDKITFKARSTAKGHEHDDAEIIISGDIERSDRNTLVLTNNNFNHGETRFSVIAKNEAGDSTEQKFIVKKSSVAEVCREKGQQNNNDFSNLTKSMRKYCEGWYQYEQRKNTQNNSGTKKENTDSNSNSSSTTNPSSTTGSNVCVYYEAGRCWDDLENDAYDSGSWDSYFGHEGGGYNPPEGCTGICEDIYEDAYYEGFNDY